MSSIDAAETEYGEAFYGFQRSDPFELGESERRMDLRLRLPRSTSIRGVFQEPGDNPGYISVIAKLDGRKEALIAETADDRYRLGNLEPGTYEVSLALQPQRARRVTLAEGDNLVVDFEFR